MEQIVIGLIGLVPYTPLLFLVESKNRMPLWLLAILTGPLYTLFFIYNFLIIFPCLLIIAAWSIFWLNGDELDKKYAFLNIKIAHWWAALSPLTVFATLILADIYGIHFDPVSSMTVLLVPYSALASLGSLLLVTGGFYWARNRRPVKAQQ